MSQHHQGMLTAQWDQQDAASEGGTTSRSGKNSVAFDDEGSPSDSLGPGQGPARRPTPSGTRSTDFTLPPSMPNKGVLSATNSMDRNLGHDDMRPSSSHQLAAEKDIGYLFAKMQADDDEEEDVYRDERMSQGSSAAGRFETNDELERFKHFQIVLDSVAEGCTIPAIITDGEGHVRGINREGKKEGKEIMQLVH